jgi:hypothetical protein
MVSCPPPPPEARVATEEVWGDVGVAVISAERLTLYIYRCGCHLSRETDIGIRDQEPRQLAKWRRNGAH